MEEIKIIRDICIITGSFIITYSLGRIISLLKGIFDKLNKD